MSATELLVFYPQGKYLCIEFLGAKYIERQPKTPQEAIDFMNEIKPIVQQLDDYVIQHNLKEVIELNLKGVPISKLNSDTAVHLLELMTKIRPEKGILEKIRITNTNPVFNMAYKAVKSRLPKRVSSIVEFESNSKFF
jgi:plasmid replication initiation protein